MEGFYKNNGTWIGTKVIIGKNVKIGKGCVIGSEPEIKGFSGKSKNLIIKDNVVISDMVKIDCGSERDTVVGEGSYVMNNSYIGHDTVIGKSNTISPGAMIAGHVTSESNVVFGMNSTTHQRSYLESFCMIGAGSFFKGSSPKCIVWAGAPARPIKVNEVGVSRSVDLKEDEKKDMITHALKFIKTSEK